MAFTARDTNHQNVRRRLKNTWMATVEEKTQLVLLRVTKQRVVNGQRLTICKHNFYITILVLSGEQEQHTLPTAANPTAKRNF